MPSSSLLDKQKRKSITEKRLPVLESQQRLRSASVEQPALPNSLLLNAIESQRRQEDHSSVSDVSFHTALDTLNHADAAESEDPIKKFYRREKIKRSYRNLQHYGMDADYKNRNALFRGLVATEDFFSRKISKYQMSHYEALNDFVKNRDKFKKLGWFRKASLIINSPRAYYAAKKQLSKSKEAEVPVESTMDDLRANNAGGNLAADAHVGSASVANIPAVAANGVSKVPEGFLKSGKKEVLDTLMSYEGPQILSGAALNDNLDYHDLYDQDGGVYADLNGLYGMMGYSRGVLQKDYGKLRNAKNNTVEKASAGVKLAADTVMQGDYLGFDIADNLPNTDNQIAMIGNCNDIVQGAGAIANFADTVTNLSKLSTNYKNKSNEEKVGGYLDVGSKLLKTGAKGTNFARKALAVESVKMPHYGLNVGSDLMAVGSTVTQLISDKKAEKKVKNSYSDMAKKLEKKPSGSDALHAKLLKRFLGQRLLQSKVEFTEHATELAKGVVNLGCDTAQLATANTAPALNLANWAGQKAVDYVGGAVRDSQLSDVQHRIANKEIDFDKKVHEKLQNKYGGRWRKLWNFQKHIAIEKAKKEVLKEKGEYPNLESFAVEKTEELAKSVVDLANAHNKDAESVLKQMGLKPKDKDGENVFMEDDAGTKLYSRNKEKLSTAKFRAFTTAIEKHFLAQEQRKAKKEAKEKAVKQAKKEAQEKANLLALDQQEAYWRVMERVQRREKEAEEEARRRAVHQISASNPYQQFDLDTKMKQKLERVKRGQLTLSSFLNE